MDDDIVHCGHAIFKVLKKFFDEKDAEVIGLSERLLSHPPSLEAKQDFNLNSISFDPTDYFDESFFKNAEFAFTHYDRDYVWQYLPFILKCEDDLNGVFDINTIVEFNKTVQRDEYRGLTFGELKNTPIVFEHLFHIQDVIDTLVEFYLTCKEIKSTFVLPFHPLDHFLKPRKNVNEAMSLYQSWFSAYQAFSSVLIESKANFKVILGMPEWAYLEPSSEEIHKYLVNEGLGDVYKSPKRRIDDIKKSNSDSVSIETLNSFDFGDIVTIVTWKKNSEKQGQEFYYHVVGQQKSIDNLESQYIQRNIKVTRSEIDIDENIDILNILNVSRKLN